jgi:hypothetical protein
VSNSRDINTTAASFIASLLSSTSATQANVQTVLEHTSSLVSDIVEDITNEVQDSLRSFNITLTDNDNKKLLDKLKVYCTPFNSLDTQYKRDVYFRKRYGMVEGKSICIGTRYDQRVDPVTGSMRQVIIRDTFQYVPLLKLIELLLNDQSIYHDVVHGHSSRDGIMRDFCDGSLFRSISLFAEDKNAL